MQVLIATPTSGQVVTSAYPHSLVAATKAIHALDGSYQHLTFDSADLVLARNFMASEFLSDPYLTHILFLGSDMLTEEPVFRRLLTADKQIVGAVYPDRHLDWAVYTSLIQSGVNDARARAAAMDFDVQPIGGGYTMSNGWCKAGAIGAGCMLVKKKVFLTLIRTGAAKPIRSPRSIASADGGQMHDFFGQIQAQEGDYLTGDHSFCRRVLSAGFEIWGLADATVGRMGRHEFSGRFLDHLEQTAHRQDIE